MLDEIKFLLFRRRILSRAGVGVARSAYCDNITTFEGRNRVYNGAKLYRSRLGLGSYVGPRCLLTNTSIGRFSCIGPEVQTVIGAHPTAGFVSIHPAFFSTREQAGFTFSTEDKFPEFGENRNESDILVEIGSDVWIGYGARLMQGIRIGHGAVVAAGSIVTKDVPPFTIVGGVPARTIKQRFPEATIKRLLATEWWQRDFTEIEKLAPLFINPEELLDSLEKTALSKG